jgi:hypothetical protein
MTLIAHHPQAAPYHQLGVVAQELEHWEAARSWYVMALRAAAEAADFRACARICHQLSETYRAEAKLDEAITWSIIAFVAHDTAVHPGNRSRAAETVTLPPNIRLADTVEAWRATTETALPAELARGMERILMVGAG